MRTAILIAFAAAAFASAADQVDGVAASVGSEQILRSDVIAEMRRAGAEESRYGEVLNSLVERKLATKAAKDAGMTLQEWIVDNRVREIIDEGFGGDRNRLIEALSRQKIPFTDWRQKIKDDMIVSAIRWHAVDKNVSASPSELRAEYAAHPERYRTSGRTSVSVILLKPEDAGRRAEVEEAVAAEGFAAAARRFSADGKASEGGLWKDIRPEDEFRPEICEAISQLKPGATSGWIELDGWSFLVRSEANAAAPARTFAEAYEDIESNVKAEKAEALYRKWMDGLKSETYIKIY
ncbi:MAG: peptidyl-prolyl cis-trans isomerase [Kiritimatiellae bacterium]|nr:peptidyl-prolyl cis-trans isomerase [Kiritimatiellia bacterium]